MARIEEEIEFLRSRPGKLRPDGERARNWWWEPSATLRAAGWRPVRLGLPGDCLPGESVEAAAFRQARARNRSVQAWRDGAPLPDAPAADRRRGAPERGTWDAVLADYKKTSRWSKLVHKTRLDYEYHFRTLRAWLTNDDGSQDRLAELTKADVEDLYEKLRGKTPVKAAAVVRHLHLILQFAVDREILHRNVADKLELESADPKAIIWTREAERVFVEAADARGMFSIGDAIVANIWLGQRPGNLFLFPRSIVEADTIVLRQSKRRRRVPIPIGIMTPVLDRLRSAQERWKGRAVIPTTAIARDDNGRPWTVDSFGRQFAELRETVARRHPRFQLETGQRIDVDAWGAQRGMAPAVLDFAAADLQFRHTRHTAVTRMRAAGLTAEQIAGIVGWSLDAVNQIIDVYFVRTADDVREGVQSRLAHEGFGAAPGGERKSSDG